MIELILALVVTGLAWFSARLSVVAAIITADDADHMIRHMLRETFWISMFVMGMWVFTSWGTGIILFFVPRMLFLICTDWHTLCNNFHELKQIVR